MNEALSMEIFDCAEEMEEEVGDFIFIKRGIVAHDIAQRWARDIGMSAVKHAILAPVEVSDRDAAAGDLEVFFQDFAQT